MTWLDPDPFFSSADPGSRIRIHIKIKWIPSTALKRLNKVNSRLYRVGCPEATAPGTPRPPDIFLYTPLLRHLPFL